jgi:hypothetical protein
MNKQSQWLFESPHVLEHDRLSYESDSSFADEFIPDLTISNLLLINAIKDKRLDRAGVYSITWKQNGKTHVYNGKSGGHKQTLRERLQDHHLCIKRFGGDPSKYRVNVQLMQPSSNQNYPARLNRKNRLDLKTRENKRISQSKSHKNRVSHNKSKESDFLFEVAGSCSSTGFSDANCGAVLALPISGCCKYGFLNTCYSHTFIPTTNAPLNIKVNVGYVSMPAPWVSDKEDFSIQVRKCGQIWDTDIGSKRTSRLGLPNTLSFSIAAVTPGEKYYIKIYSRSSQALVSDYQIWQ